MTETFDFIEVSSTHPREQYFQGLDRILESKDSTKRRQLSEKIYHARESLLDIVEQDPLTYQITEASKDGVVKFTHPEGREIAKKKIVDYIKHACKKFDQRPTEETFTHAFGGIVALGELTLFDPKDIHESARRSQEHTPQYNGINPKQIDAMMSLFTSHSTRVRSGQGKSNPDAVISSIAKVLLKHTQVHNYVIDEFARKRDSAQIKKMADLLTLPVFEFSDIGSDADIKNDYKTLTVQRTLVSQLPITPNRKALLQTIQRKISAHDRANAFANAREALMPSVQKESPAIAVGTDGDFKFAYLKNDHPELFTGKIEAIADEGDLLWRADTVNVLEAPNNQAIEGYLPDWISMIVANDVCKQLLKSGDIVVDNGFYTFNDELRDDSYGKYERRFKRRLKKIHISGQLPEEYQEALYDRLQSVKDTLPVQYRMSTQDMHKSAKQLIRAYAIIPKRSYSTGSYAQAWMQAQPMRDGTEYATGNNAVSIIDKHTGRQLTSHRYQDLLDIAVDVGQSVCSLRGGVDVAQGSTGHWSFLKKVYHEKQYAILTATTEGIEAEILERLEKPVIHSEPWIGESVPIPDYSVENTQEDALALLQQLIQNPRPHLIVTDNDHEVESIKQSLLSALPSDTNIVISTITSKSSVEEEKKIYKTAGNVLHITIANPKAGRMIDIKTSQEADSEGGLRVVAWGPLYANDVLLQTLQRTKRAGHPGSAEWIIYKYGGYVGLADHPLLQMFPNYMRSMEAIQPKTTSPYEYSLIEELHARQFELTSSRRLQILYEDTIRDYLTDSIKEAIKKMVVIKEDKGISIDDHILFTPAYIERFVSSQASIIQSVAHAESKLKNISDMKSELKHIGSDLSHIRTLANSLVKFQFSSSLAKNLNAVITDAIGTISEKPSDRRMRTIPIWERLYTDYENIKDQQIFTLPIPKTIRPLIHLSKEMKQQQEFQRITVGEYLKSEQTEYVVLADLPNILLTVRRVIIGAKSKKSKNIPLLHECSFRLTTMKPDTKSIEEDLTFSYKSRVQKNGKLNKKNDQVYLKKYLDLLMDSLKEKAENTDSIKATIKELRRILRMKKITKFSGKQAF